MKKYLFPFLFLVLVISVGTFSACKKKKGVYIIEGTLTDNTFAQNMSKQNLQVNILKAGNSGYTNYSTVSTDANGKYHIEVERDLIDQIRIIGTKNNYFPIEFTIPVSSLTVGEAYLKNYATTAKSWVRLVFIHNTGDPNAILEYIKTSGKQDCAECCPKTTQTITGFANDTVYCINNGNDYYGYNYTIVGTPVLDSRVAFTPAFDTAEIVLNY